jgi:hypothetical protein
MLVIKSFSPFFASCAVLGVLCGKKLLTAEHAEDREDRQV